MRGAWLAHGQGPNLISSKNVSQRARFFFCKLKTPKWHKKGGCPPKIGVEFQESMNVAGTLRQRAFLYINNTVGGTLTRPSCASASFLEPESREEEHTHTYTTRFFEALKSQSRRIAHLRTLGSIAPAAGSSSAELMPKFCIRSVGTSKPEANLVLNSKLVVTDCNPDMH